MLEMSGMPKSASRPMSPIPSSSAAYTRSGCWRAGTKYDNAKSGVFYRQLLESLRVLPGVRGAAVSSGIPFGAGSYNTSPMMTMPINARCESVTGR